MLHGLSLPKLLEDSPSDAIHVWVAQSLAPKGVPRRAADSFKTEEPAAALTCYRAGASLYFRAPEELSELLVTALSQQLGMSFGAIYPDGAPRSEVETFASRAGHVTDWHFDFMHNFTLQLRGVKRWRLKPSGVQHPVRGCTPMWSQADATTRDAAEAQAKNHAQHAAERGAFDVAPDAEHFHTGWEEVLLRPGSVLYVPAGMWHRVECEEDSLSINVSLMGMSWADMIGGAVAQRLRAHAAARQPVAFHSLAEGRAQLAEALAILRDEAAALTPADLLPACMPLPRAVRVALPLIHERGTDVGWLREDTLYRRNPLAVLLRLPRANESDGESNDGDVDDADPGASDKEGAEDSENESDGSNTSEGNGDSGGTSSLLKAGEATVRRPSSRAAAHGELCAAIASLEVLTSTSELLTDGVDELAIESWNGEAADRAEGSEASGVSLGEEHRASDDDPDASSPDDEEDMEAELEPISYALHAQFGGDDYASLLRVEIVAPPPLARFLDWCRAAPDQFRKSEALEAAGHDVTVGTVAAAMARLEHVGFCRPCSDEPAKHRTKKKRATGSEACPRAAEMGRRADQPPVGGRVEKKRQKLALAAAHPRIERSGQVVAHTHAGVRCGEAKGAAPPADASAVTVRA